MNKRIQGIFFVLTLLTLPIFSQQTKEVSQPKEVPQLKEEEDTAEDKRLPFPISKKKKVSAEELAKKKEGWFVTGLGGPFSDANTGFGVGGRINLFNNGKKDDPFFAYTPYRHRIFFNPSMTTKGAQYHELNWDAPFIFDTQWRARANAVYDKNPNNLFFGLGEKAMEGLSYRNHNDPSSPYVNNASFPDQQNNLNYMRNPNSTNEIRYLQDPYLNSTLINQNPQLGNAKVTDRMYNRYQLEAPSINLSGERSFFGGLMRVVLGTRFSKNTVKTFDGELYKTNDPYFGNSNYMGTNYGFPNILPAVQGKTKVTEDAENGKIIGLKGGYVNLLRIGLVYDTRDYEPDPSRGIFAEVTHERSDNAWGSNYTFNRTYGSFRFYQQIFPSYFKKLVFAGRASMVNTRGDAPFFEYRNMWGTEGNISGLGGRTTLRGYMQDRFAAPVMGFVNLELRWRVLELPGFTFNIAPLLDIGRPWDKLSNVNLMTDQYKYSYGVGLRMIWNQSTVIYAEWARSRETLIQDYSKGPFAGTNFYFNFGHIF